MFRRLDDALVNVVTFGAGEVTLLGVGGWIGNWELWQQPFELLSGRFRCVAYDHFGAGETVAGPDLWTFDAQVDAVHALLDLLELERCVLLGESNGGAVAMATVLRWPERFDALVLVDAPHSGFDQPQVRAFVDALRRDFPATIHGFVDLCTPEPDVEHIRRWTRNILLKATPEAAVALLETMYPLDLRPSLPEIETPTLVLHGALDALAFTRPEVAEETARLVPGARLHILPEAGHVPTLTRPQEVAHAIDGFLAETVGSVR